MSTFILLHGAWHGSWCWKLTKSLLTDQDHIVLTPDLPGSGNDTTPIKKVSLSLYVKKLVTLINSCNDNVILVGHSMSGIVISAIAEEIPNKISILVYLCAFMPQNNQCLFDIRKSDINHSLIELEFSHDNLSHMPKNNCIETALYGRCGKEEIEFAKFKLKPQAAIIAQTRVSLSEIKFGAVPKIYIECTEDKALSIHLQREMIKAHPRTKVYSINADHSPFLSAPKILAEILHNISL